MRIEGRMNEEWWRVNEEWWRINEGWLRMMISSCWGVLQTDRGTDEQTDICNCRVAFATENLKKKIEICLHFNLISRVVAWMWHRVWHPNADTKFGPRASSTSLPGYWVLVLLTMSANYWLAAGLNYKWLYICSISCISFSIHIF